VQVPILLAPPVCRISKILPARTVCRISKILPARTASGTDVDTTADSGTDVDTTADSGVDTDADSGTDVDSDVDSGMDTTADGGTDGGTNVDSDAYNGVDTAAYRGTATDAEDDTRRLHRRRPRSRLCLGHHPLGPENAGQLAFAFEYTYLDECLSHFAENGRPRAFRLHPGGGPVVWS
jgi:hypothetical protein